MERDVVFHGVAAPLRLEGADAVVPLLSEILSGWPFEVRPADQAAPPFFAIRLRAGSEFLWCESLIEGKPPRPFDPVNAVCDAIVALAYALPAENPDQICLHAAGVAVSRQLIVFPNIRRAGKSMLSAALAKAGHAVFSDDFVPMSFTGDGCAVGRATGIAPRLRLPLPEMVGHDLHQWIEGIGGPQNRQYRYLTLDGQPGHGTLLPVAAFVILDRRDEATAARLEPVSADAAMDALLHQNFTRDRHSADVLQEIAAALVARPVFQMTYCSLDDAVACLEAAVAGWPQVDAAQPARPARSFRLADLAAPNPVRSAGDGPVRQRLGTLAVEIGQGLYLADAEGRAIHRMDPLAAVIWSLLEEPATEDEIAMLLAEVFPDVGLGKLRSDLRRLLRKLSENSLIEVQAPADRVV